MVSRREPVWFRQLAGKYRQLAGRQPTSSRQELAARPDAEVAFARHEGVVSALVANKTMEVASGFIFAAFGVAVAILPLPSWLRLGLLGIMLLAGICIIAFCAFQRSAPLPSRSFRDFSTASPCSVG